MENEREREGGPCKGERAQKSDRARVARETDISFYRFIGKFLKSIVE